MLIVGVWMGEVKETACKLHLVDCAETTCINATVERACKESAGTVRKLVRAIDARCTQRYRPTLHTRT